MKALYWEALRHRWTEKQLPPGMEEYTRLHLLAGTWPQVWQGPDNSIIVTATYFGPKAEKYSQYLTAPAILFALYLAGSYLYTPKTPQSMGLVAVLLIAAGLVATIFSRVICYHIFSKRLRIEFMPGGEIRFKGANVPAGVPRTFLVQTHDLAPQEQNEEDFYNRSSARPKSFPRYYRDSTQVILSYGSENSYKVEIASIGADGFFTLGNKLRGVLAEANKTAAALPPIKSNATLADKAEKRSEFD